jgi:hypothetical protein
LEFHHELPKQNKTKQNKTKRNKKKSAMEQKREIRLSVKKVPERGNFPLVYEFWNSATEIDRDR